MLELPSDPFNFLEEEAMNGVCHLFIQISITKVFQTASLEHKPATKATKITKNHVIAGSPFGESVYFC